MNLDLWQLLSYIKMQQKYVQHPALKPANEKSQSLIGGKFFPFCRTVFIENENG